MADTIGVFVSPETDALFSFHFNKCWITHLITVYNDREAFVASRHDRKIACYQMPYPMQATFHDTVLDLIQHCDHVLILMSELHDRTVEFVPLHDHERISYFICGDFDFELTHSTVHKFYDWFTTTVHFYKHVRPNLLDNTLHPYTVKPKMFDALLGRKKPHRDIAYTRLNREQNVVTYLGTTDCDFSTPDKWRWESDGLILENPVEWTVERVNYHGHRMSLSQVAPLSIYNETAYTLIAETSYSHHFTFYTEKTVKPILARRLFVLLGGTHGLRNLQRIGFRTFSNVIDESYDSCIDLDERCTRALEQVEYLSTLDQEEVLDKIKSVCDHNYSHMMRTDWYGQYFMPAFISYFVQTQN
jgi:hypothetical protein